MNQHFHNTTIFMLMSNKHLFSSLFADVIYIFKPFKNLLAVRLSGPYGEKLDCSSANQITGFTRKPYRKKIHNITQPKVSQIFTTWIDRLCYRLGQLSNLTDRETMKENLPTCFKPDYEDVYVIIDYTKIFIEKCSQIIQQGCPCLNIKDATLGRD